MTYSSPPPLVPLRSLSRDEDLRDARAVRAFLDAARIGGHRISPANRAAREAVQKYWQEPRFPVSELKRPRGLRSQFALALPWSPAARSALAGGQFSRKLVLEHVVPIGQVTARLATRVREEPGTTDSEMVELLLGVHAATPFAVITPEEHGSLDESVPFEWTPSGGPTEPWLRYRRMDLGSFRPITQHDLDLMTRSDPN